MIKKETIENLSTFRIVKINFLLVWALFLYGLVRFSISLPYIIREIHKDKTPTSLIGYIGNGLNKIAVFYILVYLYLIIRSLSRGNAFHPRNPSRLRKLALGIFAFGVATFLQQFIIDIVIMRMTSLWYVINKLGYLLWWIFIGAVVLMIAEAFAKGIQLQHDQDLTV